MPNHIHLLIEPGEGTNLSMIMCWIKTRSAKRWNGVHGSKDHVWGHRYFARPVRDHWEYDHVMNYIDQNPVKAGLVTAPADWKASGAYHKAHNLHDLVDFALSDRQKYIKLLSPIPPEVSRLLPPNQLSHILQYYGTYAEAIERLYTLIPKIPALGDTDNIPEPPACLRYFTGTADYYIYEYDGEDTMYGKVCYNVYRPDETECRKFSLSNLKSNSFIQLRW